MRKQSSSFKNLLQIWVPLWPSFVHFGAVLVSGCPRMRRKSQGGQDFAAFFQVQCKSETMGTALVLLDEESGIPWISLSLSCPSQTFLLLPGWKCCFFKSVVSNEVEFTEWGSALLPGSGSASCCCSENWQIYPLVDLKAEKVPVNTGTFLLPSLINHSMGFISPVS